MKISVPAVRQCLKAFDLKTLFREHLGWDNHQGQLDIVVDGATIPLTAVAEKRGFVAYVCPSIPERPLRFKIDHQVTKSSREHLIVYTDKAAGQQVWQWVRREPGKPLASRDHRYDASQSGEPLIQRLKAIAIDLDEEEKITVVDVAGRARAAFDVDKVTKQFYDRFKSEHAAFLKGIKGFPPPIIIVKDGKKQEEPHPDVQWYTSVMLNRMMFVYFIQKKGFLDGNIDYLRNRMQQMRQEQGKDKFVTFYRYFLLRLFHEGLGKAERNAALDKLLGTVPYLNGGFFEVHQLEERHKNIDIPDKAFEKLFDFFDQYRWHLDERPLRQDKEINPNVVGYIFEKYINQKQMGAYYTKEDITEYNSKNTIIPFLFDAAEKKCPIAFRPDGYLWRLLKENPDRYIYAAVKQGVIDATGEVIALPKEIEAGVKDVAKRDGWNKPATEPYGLPTETWREHVARRARCLDLRKKLKDGDVHTINDLITLNLDIWQFARDAITSSEGPELLRAFWQAIEKVTCLDPTCGSGAFLFAALHILESLYSDCLARMEQFLEDIAGKPHHPEKFADFRAVLAQMDKHPNRPYFILKSIIINNLFGVDIMEEAVEICKLRLFLKLVAQVEKVEQIEPLPDIDFNIRAGNTLVGFSSLDQVRKSLEGTLGFGEKQVEKIKEDAIAVECIFKLFREQQTKHGGKITAKDKHELRQRLETLDLELDHYLAGEYGIDAAKKKDVFEEWRKSHQPFHWFVEFYGIMRDGGFNVIVGNPPYVEYTKVKRTYTLLPEFLPFATNLYSACSFRAIQVKSQTGYISFVVPVSLPSTDRMQALRDLLVSGHDIHFASFSTRPSKLFEGAEQRLTIFCQSPSKPGQEGRLYSAGYLKWSAAERKTLFSLIEYVETRPVSARKNVWPKLKGRTEAAVFNRLSQHVPLGASGVLGGSGKLYYKNTGLRYFNTVTLRPPRCWINGKATSSSRETTLGVRPDALHSVHCFLLSSAFFIYYQVMSN